MVFPPPYEEERDGPSADLADGIMINSAVMSFQNSYKTISRVLKRIIDLIEYDG